jgi:nitric oxide reductase large subunit
MKQTINKNLRLLRVGLIVTLALLVIQFVVGMYLNFYTELPDTHPGTGDSYAPSIPWALAGHAGPALAIHVVVWILLTLGAIALLVRSIMSKRKAFIIGTSLGLLFILMAGSGGLTFLNRGGDDKESFMMAIGFILAFITYGITFYKTKEN